MINAININSSEMLLRKKELNILRTIGMSKKQVDKMLYLEGILVAVIAAIIGNIIGCLMGNAIFRVFMLGTTEEGESMKIPWHIDFPAILFVTILLLAINIFAVWITKPENQDIELG